MGGRDAVGVAGIRLHGGPQCGHCEGRRRHHTPSHGVTVNQLDIVITNPDHPLAAGLSGRVQAYRVQREMNWGAHLAPGARWWQRLRLPSRPPVMPPPTDC